MLSAGHGKYPYNEGGHLIAAVEFWAYGDESGIEGNAKLCMLLGYVGAPNEWESFNVAWVAVLKKYCVQEFHAADFFAQ